MARTLTPERSDSSSWVSPSSALVSRTSFPNDTTARPC
ncbi:hypothetical protein P3T36_000042 [Kitasatospora sp. MAP12-15]|nr:hypothetical protein [Kitasatospora sp. MAP12-44]